MNIILTDKKGQTLLNIPQSINSNISIINNCPSSLPRNRSCSFSVTYNATLDSTNSNNQEFLNIFGQSLTQSVSIDNQVSNLETINITPLTSSLILNISEPNINNYSIRFINRSIKSISSQITAITSHSGIIVNSIQCSGGLLRNRSCNVNFSLNSNILPEGQSNQTLKLGNYSGFKKQ